MASNELDYIQAARCSTYVAGNKHGDQVWGACALPFNFKALSSLLCHKRTAENNYVTDTYAEELIEFETVPEMEREVFSSGPWWSPLEFHGIPLFPVESFWRFIHAQKRGQ